MSATSLKPAMIALWALGIAASCSPRGSSGPTGRIAANRSGVSEVEAIDPSRIVAGQTIYVPVYSSVSIADRAVRYDLAITLYIRNTDPSTPIVLTGVRYLDHDGSLVREHVNKPVKVAPLAAMDYFVKASDSAGGLAPSFLVEWVADQPANAPIAEAVMVGTAGTQGVSFTTQGKVIADRLSPKKGPG
jgi:Protein of unknown function (DUF3124)